MCEMRVARGGELAHTRESWCEGACTGGVGMGVGVGCDDDTAVDIIEVGPQRRRFGRSQSDFDASAAASPTRLFERRYLLVPGSSFSSSLPACLRTQCESCSTGLRRMRSALGSATGHALLCCNAPGARFFRVMLCIGTRFNSLYSAAPLRLRQHMLRNDCEATAAGRRFSAAPQPLARPKL